MDTTKNFQKWYTDFTCGHCYKKSGYDIQYADADFYDEQLDVANGLGFAVVKCRSCECLNVITLNIEGEHYYQSIDSEFELQNILNAEPQIIMHDWINDGMGITDVVYMLYQGQYPYGLDLDKIIPEQIRVDLCEAFNCLSVNAANASMMMSRRVVQQITIHFDIDSKTGLKAALGDLKRHKHITDGLYDALMEIKNWGDDGAHPGEFDPIFLKEARKVANLVLLLTKNIFPAGEIPKYLADELKRIRERMTS